MEVVYLFDGMGTNVVLLWNGDYYIKMEWGLNVVVVMEWEL